MDPVTALGAAAAGAQFVGLAVKSLLGSAKLIQDIRDEPKRAIELLTWVEDEVTSMKTLLHPESLVFSHITTDQYVQIAPHAIKARKAMDKVNNVLSPLVRDIENLKSRDDLGKRIILAWKSILTLKSMKSIEKDLETIRLLNATLLRELQVCGLETQSLLRNQCREVLSIVSEISKRDEELRQSVEQINVSTAALAQTFATINSAGDPRFQEVLQMHMMQMSYLQAIQDKLSMTEVHTPVSSEANSGSSAEPEAGAINIVNRDIATTKRGSRFLRCRCRNNMVSAIREFGPFAYKTSRQAFQVCPLHGNIGQRSYSIEANLKPWANGLLQLSLGMLYRGKTWSILPSLEFQGTVKRSESPIFRLIDDFISSCSTLETGKEVQWEPGMLIERASRQQARLVWNSQQTKNGLAGVIRGINESTSAGLASCSDADERGNTLLSELSFLFASLGTQISGVEREMEQMIQIASHSKLDPTRTYKAYNDGRAVTPWSGLWKITVGESILHSTLMTGVISASLYEALLDYEGLVFSAMNIPTSHVRTQMWKAATSDPYLAEGMCIKSPRDARNEYNSMLIKKSIALGYSHFSIAVISRSLERLKKQNSITRDVEPSTSFRLSPLELAVGWPEGLVFLLDNDYGDFGDAFRLACELQDIKSARTLLSAKAAIPFDHSDLRIYGEHRICFQFAEVLDSARKNLTIFRLAAEELWSRKDTLTASLLDFLKLEHLPDLLQTKLAPTSRGHLEMASPPRNLQAMSDLLSSAVHANRNFGSRHHQILFDVGFTDIDTWCGGAGTPLSFICQMSLLLHGEPTFYLQNSKVWISSALWLLKAGASSKLRSDDNYIHGKHIQFFLAAAEKSGLKLGKEFLKTLGHRNERYLHDDCTCRCYSKGCIPSFGCRRYEIALRRGHLTTRQNLARTQHSMRKWARYWGYTKQEKEFIYREACRHELFERLGMRHLCCMPNFLSLEKRRPIEPERQQIQLEDTESAHNLEFLLHFYVLLRKFYSRIPIETFLAHWWDIIDTVLPPIDVPSPQEIFSLSSNKLLVRNKDLENSRDDRWRESLEGAGYKDWDYRDVIRDHCTKVLLKARAHKEKEIAWKRHRLVTKPRFVRKRPSKSSNVQSEDEWSS